MQKKILLSLSLAVVTFMAAAQNSNRISAGNYLSNGDLAKAKNAIDAASIHEKTNTDPRVFKLKGDIYKAIILSEEESVKPLKEGAIDEAIIAYDKALETLPNSSRITKEEILSAYTGMIAIVSNEAINAYNNNDFANSSVYFEKQAQLGDSFGYMDTAAYFNAGLTAAQAGDNTRAIAMYSAIKETGYNEADLFYEIARMQIENEKINEALATIEEGKAKYPGSKNLLLLETNIYLQDESKMEQAIQNLNTTIADDLSNPSLYYARGTLYQKNPETMDKAEADFKKCVELDPNHFEANYNLGALYVNQSSDIQEQMNALDFSEQKKYDELKAKRDELFKKAIAPLEKAAELKPEEKGVMATLLELYGKTGQTDKYNEMKAKLGK